MVSIVLTFFLESVIDSCADLMIIPQATLGGKMKGKQIQFHGLIKKDLGKEMFYHLIELLRKDSKIKIVSGTYGNRQVLQSVTEGPFSSVFDF